MRFNRTLKNQIPRPYPQGYQAPSTLLFNTDQAQLVIGDPEPQAVLSLNESLPEQIEVMVAFEPIFIDSNHAYVQVDDKKPLQLYQEADPVLERLEFKMVSMPEFTDLTIEYISRWELDFGFQSQSFHYHPTGATQDVWEYGGFYQPGCELNRIQQQFFSLISDGDQTELKLSSLSLWHTHGITPPIEAWRDDRRIIFHGSRSYKNLQDFIESGGLQFNLNIEAAVIQSYASVSVRPIPEQKLSIQFEKKEDEGEKET